MYNFFLLLKIRIKEMMNFSKIFSVLFFAIGFFVSYQLARFLDTQGLTPILPLVGFITSSVICFISVVLSLNETFSGNEDSEFLLSMPFSPAVPVFVMFTIMYARNLILCSMIEIPFYIVYHQSMYTVNFGVGAFICGLLTTCLPICGIATLVGMVVLLSLVDSPKKNQIMSSIALMFVIVAIVVMLFVVDKIYLISSGREVLQAENMSAQIIKELSTNIKLARFYQKGLVEGDIGNILLYEFMSFIWYAVLLFLHTMAYQTTITRLRCPVAYGEKEADVILNMMKENSSKFAILKKEINQFVGSKTYLIHSMIGIILGILVPIDLMIINYHPKNMMTAMPFLVCVFIGLSCTAYCSMSMEGRRYWIIESSPVRVNELIKIKLSMNLILTLPMSLISSILLILAFRPGMVLGLLYVLIPLIYSVVNAYYASVIGSRFANYQCESEAVIMKSGRTYVLGYLPGVIIPIIIFILLL